MVLAGTGANTTVRFRNALGLALAVHAALLFGVSFNASQAQYKAPQIEVTLAISQASTAPDDARHIAVNDQAGSGNLDMLDQMSSRENLPFTGDAPQQTPRRQMEERDARYQDALTTAAINQRVVNTDRSERDREQIDLDGISPEVDELNRELASLQAELARQNLNYSRQPRVRRLSAASAKRSVDAAYLLDWRRGLEAVGNQFYPEASVRYGIYGDLRLLVIIRSDGSLEDIEVLSSSGYAVLDEAAIKIVRLAAPYSPFPAELKATTDKLEIVRTWQFRENQLSSNESGNQGREAL
ncbi:MAG: energy transducer TonB [Halioglobus sp.]|nr:energy transducer TonB [Halioglobus sp.]